jgi:hypothetical protein
MSGVSNKLEMDLDGNKRKGKLENAAELAQEVAKLLRSAEKVINKNEMTWEPSRWASK